MSAAKASRRDVEGLPAEDPSPLLAAAAGDAAMRAAARPRPLRRGAPRDATAATPRLVAAAGAFAGGA
jgi:hypothetical protein